MGAFVDITGSQGSKSEKECGEILAAVVATKWVVILRPAPPGQARVGGNTADCMVYSSGAPGVPAKPDLAKMDSAKQAAIVAKLDKDETKWGTVDVYSPEASSKLENIGQTVAKKLSSQAKAVIVDLAKFTGGAERDRVVSKILSEVGKDKQLSKSPIIFRFQKTARVYNEGTIFKKTGDVFLDIST